MEVLAGIGAAASVLQLSQQICQSIKDLYGFLSSVKNAPKIVEATQATLSQLQELSRHIQRYEGELRALKPDASETGVLLTVEEVLRECNVDIQSLRDIVPIGVVPGSRKFTKRLKVAFNDERIAKAVNRLESHKCSLQLALTVIGRLHDVAIRRDSITTQTLLEQQGSDVAMLASSLEAMRVEVKTDVNNIMQTMEKFNFSQVGVESCSADAANAVATVLEILRTEIRNQTSTIIESVINVNALSRLDWLQAVSDALPGIVERATSNMEVHTQLKPLAYRHIENPAKIHHPPNDCIVYESRSLMEHGKMSRTKSSGLSEMQFSMSQTPRGATLRVSQINQKASTHNVLIGVIRICVRRTTTSEVDKSSGTDVREPLESITLVSLEFQPLQRLLSKGLNVRSTWKTSVHGAPTVSASLTTFHTIPLESPVFSAIIDNDTKAFRDLLESKQASLFDRDTIGNSVLHIAAMHSSTDICEYLVSLGADPLVCNNAGKTALDLAMMRSVDVGMLEGTFEGMVSEVARRIGIFKIFIKADVDFSEWDNTKWFARHECLPWKQQRKLNATEIRVLLELISFLNKIGAQPKHRGKVDAHGLGGCDSVYTMQALLADEQTNPDVRDEEGRNALHLLARRTSFGDSGWEKCTVAQIDFCYKAKVEILIGSGCRLYGFDNEGRTPSMLAQECGNEERWNESLKPLGLSLEGTLRDPSE